MPKTTMGKIIARPEDERRRLIWDALKPLRWRGYESGLFIVELDPETSIKVDLSTMDVSVWYQADTILERIVEINHSAVVEMAGSCDPDDLLGVARCALAPVRAVGYGGGEFSLRMPGGFTLRYNITQWDATIAKRFDELLDRICSENHDAVEGALASVPTSTAA